MAKRIVLFLLTNLAVMAVLFVVCSIFGVGNYLGPNGIDPAQLAIFAAIAGFAGSFFSLLISKWAAKFMMGVQIINPQVATGDERWLVERVHDMARKSGINKMPEVGIYNSPEVNAFATGPSKNNSLVAVSAGLLQHMDRDQVEAVLAHEVGHIANGDMVTMALIQGVINTFAIWLSRMIAWAVSNVVDERIAMLVFYLVSFVLQMVFTILGSLVAAWFSRQREFRADAFAGNLVGNQKMISALQALQRNHELIDTRQPAYATAKMSGAPAWLQAFSTHPPLEKRIDALRAGR